jgi:hypothetical protein
VAGLTGAPERAHPVTATAVRAARNPTATSALARTPLR